MKANSSKKILIPILLTVFIDLLGFGILIPVIPLLLGNPDSQFYLLHGQSSQRYGYLLLGLLLATFPIAQFFAGPILGQLSDKYGRKKVLAISLIGTCLSYVIFAIGIIKRDIPLLFFARALDGFTGGNFSVAQASIADITTPETRSQNFGLMGAAFGIGFILGPYVGGKLSDPNLHSYFNATTPFWFAAGLCLINVILLMFFSYETNVPQQKVKLDFSTSISNIVKAYNAKHLRVVYLTVFLFMSGFTFFTTFASVFFINRFHFNQGNIGDFFAYIGIWVVISQVFFTRKLMTKYHEHRVLKYTIIISALTLGMLLLPGKWWLLTVVAPIFAIANGLSQAAMTGLVSRSADDKSQGEVLGINASVQALASAIPPIVSGYVAATLSADATILVSAIITLVAGIVFIRLYNPDLLPQAASN